MFTYVFVMLSILQSQFIEKGFKRTENSEQNAVLLLFLFTLEKGWLMTYLKLFPHVLLSFWALLLYRLLGTRGQHPWPRFCCFETLMRNGVKDSPASICFNSTAIDRPVILIHFSSPLAPINKTPNFCLKKIFFK